MALFIASFNIYFLLSCLHDLTSDVLVPEESALARGTFRASL